MLPGGVAGPKMEVVLPIFRVVIDRKVTNWDRVTRHVEADTQEEAWKLGEKFEQAAEESTPDDYQANFASDDYGPWSATEVTEVAAGSPEIAEVWTAKDVGELLNPTLV